MRILVAGATGVLGRATLPHLKGRDVVGLTRSQEKLPLLRALGAEGVVCDVYDSVELIRLAQERRPVVELWERERPTGERVEYAAAERMRRHAESGGLRRRRNRGR